MSLTKLTPYRKTPEEMRAEKFADKRYWMFVIQYPSSNDLPKSFKDVDAIHWQLELGTVHQCPHLQGVIQFLYPKSWKQLREMVPVGWFRPMYGTYTKAIAYCTKERTRLAGPWAWHPLGDAVLDAFDARLVMGTTIDHPSGNDHHPQIALAADSVVPNQPVVATSDKPSGEENEGEPTQASLGSSKRDPAALHAHNDIALCPNVDCRRVGESKHEGYCWEHDPYISHFL